MAKQTVSIKKTTVKVSIPKKSTGGGSKKCPTCGKFMSGK